MTDHVHQRHIGYVDANQPDHQVIDKGASGQRQADSAHGANRQQKKTRDEGLPEHHGPGREPAIYECLRERGITAPERPQAEQHYERQPANATACVWRIAHIRTPPWPAAYRLDQSYLFTATKQSSARRSGMTARHEATFHGPRRAGMVVVSRILPRRIFRMVRSDGGARKIPYPIPRPDKRS